jgi:hypothetical protein
VTLVVQTSRKTARYSSKGAEKERQKLIWYKSLKLDEKVRQNFILRDSPKGAEKGRQKLIWRKTHK